MTENSWRKGLGALALLMFVLLFRAHPVRADAWTAPAGQGQLIVNVTGTDISHQFDGSGKVTSFGYGGRFQQLDVNPYFEYGWNGRTTVVVNAFIPALRFANYYGSQSSFGLGDVETGIRRRLNSTESGTAISAEFTLKFPAYSVNRNPLPGNHQVDAEGRFMAGHGFEIGRRHSFASLGVAYRYRNGLPADQFRSDATWGVDLSGRTMFLAQYSAITSLQNGAAYSVLTNPNLQSDFDLYKGQISMVTRITKTTRIQCGLVDAFAGRNTGHGITWLLALWKNF